jgi:hypothetical protein
MFRVLILVDLDAALRRPETLLARILALNWYLQGRRA